MITAHADVVGSLLRPAELLRAREELAAGRITAAAFKEIEDRAVEWAVRLQEDSGVEVVTDGEMRRLSFQSQMTEAVEGFGAVLRGIINEEDRKRVASEQTAAPAAE